MLNRSKSLKEVSTKIKDGKIIASFLLFLNYVNLYCIHISKKIRNKDIHLVT